MKTLALDVRPEFHVSIPERSKVVVIKMTPAQWANVPDNPRQRDTEHRLKSATHLVEPSPTHQQVSMAYCEATKERWKLDGHTRSLLWERRPELAPDVLQVVCYAVSSAQEAAELYTHFDNPLATETPHDRLSGALHELSWTPSSAYMKNGNFTYGVALAEGSWRGLAHEIRVGGRGNDFSVYDLIPLWLDELKALDSINPISRRFKSQILAAALLTIRRRGAEKALPFWMAYNADQGVKLEKEIDGVEALSRLVANMSPNANRNKRTQLMARAISCFENWRLHQTYSSLGTSSGPKSTDPAKYIEPIALKAGIR